MIERACLSDLNIIKGLYKNIYPVSYTNYWFNNEYIPFETYYIKNESGICGSVVAKKHSMWLKGKKIEYAYLSHVYLSITEKDKTTYETMIKEVLNELSYQSLFVVVKPDDKKLYTDLGFESFYPKVNYKLTRDQIEILPKTGISNSFSEIELLDVYSKYASHFDGTNCRDSEYYHKLIMRFSDNNHGIVVYRNNNVAEGYAIFDYSTYPVKISEIIYLNSNALLRLLSYALSYKNTVEFSLTKAENLGRIIPTAVGVKEEEIYGYITDYYLLNKLYDTDVKSVKEFKELLKPTFINEEY